MGRRVEGIYTPGRAGALAGVNGQTIGQWARYGLITPSVYCGRPVNLYSYFDVAEAVAVKWLLEERFIYKEIHSAITQARESYPSWPLLEAPLGIAKQDLREDRGALVQREGDLYVDVGGGGGRQLTLPPTFLFQVKDTLRTGGWIAKRLNLKRIEVHPDRLGGLPTLKGRRWAVQQVALIAADDEGVSLLRDDYGLRLPEIRECVAWAGEAAKLQLAAARIPALKPLVLDGHLSSKTLVAGLRGRGFSVSTLQDLSLEDSIDPDVARQADDQVAGSWVLVTMDLTIIEDYPGFDWNRYAIAWVKVAAEPRGAPVEAAKHDIVHRHADRIAEQGPGDHFTYLRDRFYRHPPSLVSRPY